MDYKPSFSDIPAIFHRGAGKRGGVRFAPDALQSLSLFAAAPAALRSSLAATRAPAGRRCAGWGGSRGLLEVLLAMSQKHDLSGLTAVRVCNHVELNPFAEPDAQLCYDFLNTGECRRPAGMCRFRHVCSDHIEAVVDRIRSGKVGFPRDCDVDAGEFDLPGGRFVLGDGCGAVGGDKKIAMPGFDPARPGELNRFAAADAELCRDFNLTGK